MGRFSAAHRPGETMLTNIQQYALLKGLDEELHLAEPPLQRMEGALHLPVALIVLGASQKGKLGPLALPLFALLLLQEGSVIAMLV